MRKMKKESKKNKENIDKIKHSPVYAMSLGSKELFHSNFWWWLMNENKNFVNVFFDNDIIKADSVKKIEREKNHCDITIYTDDGMYVIENKIKSVPMNEQLEKYSKYKKFKVGVLTGLQLEKPKNITASGWEYKPYNDIIAKIRKQLSGIDDNVKRKVAEMYCDDFGRLCEIISNKLSADCIEWDFSDAEELEVIRFADAYKKLKTEIIRSKLIENISIKDGDTISNGEYTFKIETAYSHKEPLISFKFIYGYKDRVKNVYSIGIQIQKDKLIRYAETEQGGINLFSGGYDGFFKSFANRKWFDENYAPNKKHIQFSFKDGTEEYVTNMTPKKGTGNKQHKEEFTYNAYNDFVYQQIIIPDKNIAALAKEIKKHLEYAQKIIEESKDEIFIIRSNSFKK